MEGDDSVEGYLSSRRQNLGERTTSEVNGIIKLLHAKTGESILDCPCGYGRHSIELARRGFQITGVDINSDHLRQAMESARGLSNVPDFQKLNMLYLDYDSKFDHVINMFYSFGFFESDEENERVLQNFYNALKLGGKFLMHTDVNIPRIINGKYKTRDTRSLKDGGILTVNDSYDPKTHRVVGSWTIKAKGGHETIRRYSVRVYTKDEFVELCRKIGFRSCQVFSDWDSNPYSEDSEDMIIVASK